MPQASPGAPEVDRDRLDLPRVQLAVNAVIAQRQITAAAAAREIGIAPEHLSEFRRGRATYSPTLFLILAWLRLDPAVFLLPEPQEQAA